MDDKSFGGGPGMVLKAEPIIKAIDKIKKTKTKSFCFLQSENNLHKKRQKIGRRNTTTLFLICGRYEGVDARVKKY